MRRQTPAQQDMERRLSVQAKELGFVLGYIGNFERWGDDRKLFIWNSAKEPVWSCEAIALTPRACGAAFLKMAKSLEMR